MPGLPDPNFQQSVTYICEHHEDGAMGIVINQPLDLNIREFLDHFDFDVDDAIQEQTLFNGGPVQNERGFVLHSGEKSWETTTPIAGGINLTASKDILEDIAKCEGPANVMIALGYAGWSAGQLEAEIAANSWLTVAADQQILFETDCDQRWTSAARKLGIDVNLISNQTGHS
ncbi:MAG: putative transcriptional regulator [Cellvibrionaceae bacterium]|jgi:putative transcriptional regulator